MAALRPIHEVSISVERTLSKRSEVSNSHFSLATTSYSQYLKRMFLVVLSCREKKRS